MEDDDFDDLMCMLDEDYSEEDFRNNIKRTGEIHKKNERKREEINKKNQELEKFTTSYNKFKKRILDYQLPPTNETKVFSECFENELIKEILLKNKIRIEKPIRFSGLEMIRMVDIGESKYFQLQIQYKTLTGIIKNLYNFNQGIIRVKQPREKYNDRTLFYILQNAEKSMGAAVKIAQEKIRINEEEKQDKERNDSFLSFVYFIVFCTFIYFIISISSSKNSTFKKYTPKKIDTSEWRSLKKEDQEILKDYYDGQLVPIDEIPLENEDFYEGYRR